MVLLIIWKLRKLLTVFFWIILILRTGGKLSTKILQLFLIAKYPQIDSLSSDIQVNWISGAGYDYGHRNPTRSVTARTSTGKLYEYFGFVTIPNIVIKLKGGLSISTRLYVLYQYIEPISNKSYPDGLEMEKTFTSFINNSSETYSSLDSLFDSAKENLINRFSKIKDVSIGTSVIGKTIIEE